MVFRFKEDASFQGTSFKLDVTKINDITEAHKRICEIVGEGGLWCMINNAGIRFLHSFLYAFSGKWIW